MEDTNPICAKPYFMNHGGATHREYEREPHLDQVDREIGGGPKGHEDETLQPCSPSHKRSGTLEQAIEYELKYGQRKLNPNMEPKKLRRLISNRLSAQRSRMKKTQHMYDMEKKLGDLQAMIAVMGPQISTHISLQAKLRTENGLISQKLDTLAKKSYKNDVEIEVKKAEMKRLKELQICLNKQEQLNQEVALKIAGCDYSGLEEITSLSFYNGGSDQMLHFDSTNFDKPRFVAIRNNYTERRVTR
ncbi:hypothetical protein RJ640_025132 [Escallonia rubra]|uniref:BZIP domain-containing protein n=1 Tax=Escallonia rubra TaxID=112253 RepID=A0AA88RHE6_9ASTE|nr:hypothetical protein RJ640_025132 [Escallonia rubra]